MNARVSVFQHAPANYGVTVTHPCGHARTSDVRFVSVIDAETHAACLLECACSACRDHRYAQIQTLIEHPEGIGLYGSDMRWRDANYAVGQSLAGWYRVPDQDASHVRSLFGDESSGLHYGEYMEREA